MRALAVLWLVALTASLVPPGAAALDLAPPGKEAVVDALSPSLDALPVNVSALPVPEGGLQVAAQGQVAARVDAEPPASTDAPAPATPGPLASSPSPVARPEPLALRDPVVQSALAAFFLTATAIGLAGLRAMQERAGSVVARFARGVAATFTGLALFSRIQRDGLMDNPVRARVHSMVAQAPGLSLSEVQARAGIAWGTAVHHLRRLEANGLVVSVSERAHRRYFLVDTPAAAQRSAVSVVIHPTARRIAHLVSQRPGIDQSSICVTLGLNNPAVSKHLHQFQERGLVLSQRSGRSRHYHPTGALGAALVLLEPAQATQTTQATQATMVGTSHTPELQARVMA